MTSVTATARFDDVVGEVIPSFGDGWLTMMVRRARLIDGLRSGRYEKARNVLFASFSPTENKVPGKFCCIGVGCHLIGIEEGHLFDEEDYSYLSFRIEYCVGRKMEQYLIAQNDGISFSNNPSRIFRSSSAPARDFSQIARFLEIVWFHPQSIPTRTGDPTN